jgi:hypothetical protein
MRKKHRRREELIAALLQQPNLEKAGQSIGISVSTAYRIRKTPEFQAEYLQARREAVAQASARLQQASGVAGAVLLQAMADRTNPILVRVRAADRVLEHGRKSLESEDQELRLQRLEQQVAEILGQSRGDSL